MTAQTLEEISGLRASGRVVAEARDAMLAAVAPGVATGELDALAHEILDRHGAFSAPQFAYDFPGTTCISVNHEAAHGIPSMRRRLREGDIVNVDVSAALNGYWTDTGASTSVGEVAPIVLELLEETRAAQAAAMAVAVAGNRIADIGRAVEEHVLGTGFSIIGNLCGHGVGRWIHEDPSIPSVAAYGSRSRLQRGQVLAIEPFLSIGGVEAVEGDDGWTLHTDNGGLAAQFEHTIIVTDDQPIVLTASAR
ncbi:MAG: type I methionyl aminopeptidase [Actinobacteria bacterium]|nr:type I methionyl aminopeptidase [Actinomycetota bacterium]